MLDVARLEQAMPVACLQEQTGATHAANDPVYVKDQGSNGSTQRMTHGMYGHLPCAGNRRSVPSTRTTYKPEQHKSTPLACEGEQAGALSYAAAAAAHPAHPG